MSLFSLLFLLLAPFLCFSYTCNVSIDNATFNLRPLQLKSGQELAYYSVIDNRSSHLSNYTYVFNLCDNILTSPPSSACYNETLRDELGLPDGYCTNYNTDDGCFNISNITSLTAAYQIKHGEPSEQKCWRLHNGITEPQYDLIDKTDPTVGIKITYSDGDWCGRENINRAFTISLYCYNDYENYFDEEEMINETPTCVYNVELKSIFGCPTQCPITNYQLCSGNGICEMDWTNHKPKCFCYYGYYGSDCSSMTDIDEKTVYENNDDTITAWLFVIIILLIVVLAILGYLWTKFNRIKTPERTLNKSVQKQKKKVIKQSSKALIDNDANQKEFDTRPLNEQEHEHEHNHNHDHNHLHDHAHDHDHDHENEHNHNHVLNVDNNQ